MTFWERLIHFYRKNVVMMWDIAHQRGGVGAVTLNSILCSQEGVNQWYLVLKSVWCLEQIQTFKSSLLDPTLNEYDGRISDCTLQQQYTKTNFFHYYANCHCLVHLKPRLSRGEWFIKVQLVQQSGTREYAQNTEFLA